MIRLNKILCPVDLSEASLVALRFAKAVAARYGASLSIIHILDNPHSDIPGGTEAFSFGELMGLYKEERQEEILDVLRLKGTPSVNYEIMFKEGVPYNEIAETARKIKSDMIIMCACTGKSHDMIAGCTTERVVRLSPCPVLSVRTNRGSEQREDIEHLHDLMDTSPNATRKILLPTDFSEHSVLASKYAISLAREYKAEIIVLHVIESIAELSLATGVELPVYGVVSAYYDDLLGTARRQVGEIVDQASKHGVATHECIIYGNPRHEIVNIANSEPIDMIVIGTHGRRGFSRFIHGSVAEAVVRHALCSVLSVKNPEHDFITEGK